MTPVSRGTPAGDAYLALRRLANAGQGSTDHLLSLYALEGFLARLSISDYAKLFVLKGGFVLSAYGIRRPTRDLDLAGLSIKNEIDNVRAIFAEVLSLDTKVDDGLVFDHNSISARPIREEHLYSGVRVGTIAYLATAKIPFHVDVNVGDPIWPKPELIAIPMLLKEESLYVLGYPITMVLAEKIVTAIERGRSNTRWRDYGDIWSLIHRHDLDYYTLVKSIETVASFRNVNMEITDLEDLEFGKHGQMKYKNWRRKGFSYLPDSFLEVSTSFWCFVEPILTKNSDFERWDSARQEWV